MTTIINARPETAAVVGIAAKDYLLTSEGKLTTDTNEAAFWLVRKGVEVRSDVFEKYPGIELQK